MIHHLPFLMAHKVAKHAVGMHVANRVGMAASAAGHHAAVGHGAAMHAAGHAVAGRAVAATKVSAHGAVAQHLASGAAAKHAVVTAARGTITPASGHVTAGALTKPVIPLKHVAEQAIIASKPFRPVVPKAPFVS
jgi:hypothetical protein